MIKKIDSRSMGSGNLGWLDSKFHFSFSEYYNPDNIKFGNLRVINDDIISPHNGFDTHPHKDMEIITYVIDGELTHKDSMGNAHKLTRGQVQYMSAGTGVFHSEHNLSDEPLRLLQIWIYPDDTGYAPNYGEIKYPFESRDNKWLHLVSKKNGDADIKINQDFNIYVIEMDKDYETTFEVSKNRQAYLVQIEGSTNINNLTLNQQDGLETIEETLNIKAQSKSHIMVLEMAKV